MRMVITTTIMIIIMSFQPIWAISFTASIYIFKFETSLFLSVFYIILILQFLRCPVSHAN